MKCSPLAFNETIQDEQGNKYAPLQSYDVNGQMWHIVGTATDFVVMVPNMIDAGIYRWHRAHEEMPSEVAAALVTVNAGIVPPKKANELAMLKLHKAKEPKPLKLGGGKKDQPADTQAGGQSDDKQGYSTDTPSSDDPKPDTGEQNKNQASTPSLEDGKR